MTEPSAPERIGVIWSPEARADLRAIDRDTALRLLKSLDRFLKTDAGNVKQLEGFDPPLFRLRVGAWRIIYRRKSDDAIEVVRVRNRSEAVKGRNGDRDTSALGATRSRNRLPRSFGPIGRDRSRSRQGYRKILVAASAG